MQRPATRRHSPASRGASEVEQPGRKTLLVLMFHRVWPTGDATPPDELATLFEDIAAALSSDRTLGGLCDLVTPLAPEIGSLGINQAPSVKTAIVLIELIYVTDGQLN